LITPKFYLWFQEKFGEDVSIFTGKKKIGTKGIDEYGSNPNSSDLANDSDLDVDTRKYTYFR